MKPTHALAIAALLSVAAVLGVSAATRTQTLGASARHASAATIAARAHKLDVFEAALRKALASKTPKLPRVPAVHTMPAVAHVGHASAAPVTGASAPRVIYRRPAPIVIHLHRHHGDDGFEADGGGSAGGGGGDD
jgi:hypothetical protein